MGRVEAYIRGTTEEQIAILYYWLRACETNDTTQDNQLYEKLLKHGWFAHEFPEQEHNESTSPTSIQLAKDNLVVRLLQDITVVDTSHYTLASMPGLYPRLVNIYRAHPAAGTCLSADNEYSVCSKMCTRASTLQALANIACSRKYVELVYDGLDDTKLEFIPTVLGLHEMCLATQRTAVYLLDNLIQNRDMAEDVIKVCDDVLFSKLIELLNSQGDYSAEKDRMSFKQQIQSIFICLAAADKQYRLLSWHGGAVPQTMVHEIENKSEFARNALSGLQKFAWHRSRDVFSMCNIALKNVWIWSVNPKTDLPTQMHSLRLLAIFFAKQEPIAPDNPWLTKLWSRFSCGRPELAMWVLVCMSMLPTYELPKPLPIGVSDWFVECVHENNGSEDFPFEFLLLAVHRVMLSERRNIIALGKGGKMEPELWVALEMCYGNDYPAAFKRCVDCLLLLMSEPKNGDAITVPDALSHVCTTFASEVRDECEKKYNAFLRKCFPEYEVKPGEDAVSLRQDRGGGDADMEEMMVGGDEGTAHLAPLPKAVASPRRSASINSATGGGGGGTARRSTNVSPRLSSSSAPRGQQQVQRLPEEKEEDEEETASEDDDDKEEEEKQRPKKKARLQEPAPPPHVLDYLPPRLLPVATAASTSKSSKPPAAEQRSKSPPPLPPVATAVVESKPATAPRPPDSPPLQIKQVVRPKSPPLEIKPIAAPPVVARPRSPPLEIKPAVPAAVARPKSPPLEIKPAAAAAAPAAAPSSKTSKASKKTEAVADEKKTDADEKKTEADADEKKKKKKKKKLDAAAATAVEADAVPSSKPKKQKKQQPEEDATAAAGINTQEAAVAAARARVLSLPDVARSKPPSAPSSAAAASAPAAAAAPAAPKPTKSAAASPPQPPAAEAKPVVAAAVPVAAAAPAAVSPPTITTDDDDGSSSNSDSVSSLVKRHVVDASEAAIFDREQLSLVALQEMDDDKDEFLSELAQLGLSSLSVKRLLVRAKPHLFAAPGESLSPSKFAKSLVADKYILDKDTPHLVDNGINRHVLLMMQDEDFAHARISGLAKGKLKSWIKKQQPPQ